MDKRYAKKLAKHINHVGELDPIIVIQLGEQWVCIDGHHRLEGYKIQKWSKQIKCEYFKGTAWEAADLSLHANRGIKLEISPTDRFENAWKRVLIGRDSKSRITGLCGVGDGTVAKMRRVQKELQNKLGSGLNNTTWWKASLLWRGFDKKQISEEERAAGLAKTLRSRMDDRLSRDPKITARALMLYDLDLLHPLSRELQELTATKSEVDDADIEPELAGVLLQIKRREDVSDEALRQQLVEHEEKHAKREAIIREIKAELQTRGVVSKSDLMWDKWQRENALAKAKKTEQENAIGEE